MAFLGRLLAVAEETEGDAADVAERRGIVLAELVGADVVAQAEEVARAGHVRMGARLRCRVRIQQSTISQMRATEQRPMGIMTQPPFLISSQRDS